MLVAVVVVETIVLALLSVVVVALLRSHAEILRRLPEPEEPEPSLPHDEPIVLSDGARLPAHLPSPRRRATEAHDISGTTPAGDAVVVSMAVGSNTVLAFLSTGCLTCRTFWDGLQPAVRTPLPGGARVVVVVKVPVTSWSGYSMRAATTVPNNWKTCFSWIVLCRAHRLHWMTSMTPSRSASRSRPRSSRPAKIP